MIKLFSDIKANDPQSFDEVVRACKSEPGSDAWFCTKSFGELKRVSEFIDKNSWNLDTTKIIPHFTNAEWQMIESLIATTRPDALESRERAVKSMTQRTTRFVEHWLKQRDVQRQIDELTANVKRKSGVSETRKQWDKLQDVFS